MCLFLELYYRHIFSVRAIFDVGPLFAAVSKCIELWSREGRTHLMPHWNPIMMEASKNRVLLDLRHKPHVHRLTWMLFTFFSLIYFSDLIPSFPIPCFYLVEFHSTASYRLLHPLSCSLAPSMCFFSICLPPFFPSLSQTRTVSLEMSWPLLEMAFWTISSWQARSMWQDSVRAPQNK